MNTNPDPENFTTLSMEQMMAYQSTPAMNLYPILQMQVQRAGTLEASFSLPFEPLIGSLQCPTDYDAEQLLRHELYWAQLEMNQFGPYSFTAAPQVSSTGESLIQFEIRPNPVRSPEFGYLLIGRDPGYQDDIYLITTTQKNPEAYLAKVSQMEAHPSSFDLVDCLPILLDQRIRQRCRFLLADYQQNLKGNFYRLSEKQAIEFIRQLAQKEGAVS